MRANVGRYFSISAVGGQRRSTWQHRGANGNRALQIDVIAVELPISTFRTVILDGR